MRIAFAFLLLFCIYIAAIGQRSESNLNSGWNFIADQQNIGEKQHWAATGVPSGSVKIDVSQQGM